MDCEKFEPLLLDELYEELDELTSAAVKRHVAGCARCGANLSGLRSTRQGVSLPLIAVPAGLEERILAAAREAQKVVPIRSPMSRVLSAAGSWAMRPQTAMAAVFLLMIGTSAFVLKARRDAPAERAVSVTVAGQPSPAATAPANEAFNDDKAAAAAHGPGGPPAARPAAPPMASAIALDDALSAPSNAPGSVAREKAKSDRGDGDSKDQPADGMPSGAIANASTPAGAPRMADEYAAGGGSARKAGTATDAFSLGTAAFQTRSYAEATKQFDLAAAGGDQNAALWAASSVKEGQGCAVALGRFDQVAQRAAGSWVGNEASYRAALCQMAMGQLDAARARLDALAQTSTHGPQARSSLTELGAVATRRASSGAAVGGVAAPRPAPARAPEKKAAPATTQQQSY